MLEGFTSPDATQGSLAEAQRCNELSQFWARAALHLGGLDHSQKSHVLLPQFCTDKPVEESAISSTYSQIRQASTHALTLLEYRLQTNVRLASSKTKRKAPFYSSEITFAAFLLDPS